MTFDGGADLALWLTVLAAGLGGFLGVIVFEVVATVRHRRIVRRPGGPRYVPPSQLKGYAAVPPAYLVEVTAVNEAEPEGLLDEGEGLLC